MDVVGVVLSGGNSRRFGSPKALAKWQGSTFIEQSIQALLPNVKDIVIISNTSLKGQLEASLTFNVICDNQKYAGKGPLAGIYTAMSSQLAEWYAVMPCDMPLMSSTCIKELLTYCNSNYDAVVPYINEQKQPLCAIYHYSLYKKIESLLHTEQLRMSSLLDLAKVKWVTSTDLTCSSKHFNNINTTNELNRLLEE
jgi:molybdenum cofactor guanylyltransferase